MIDRWRAIAAAHERAIRIAGNLALGLWFAWFAWIAIRDTFTDLPYHLDVIGVDGRLYYRAAADFIAGHDPWTTYTTTNTWPPSAQYIHFLFTGPPPTVLAFVPFVLIPEWLFVIGWFGLTLAAAFYTVRRLELPVVWLLFPPLVQGILVANPHIVCLALLLCASPWLQALAAPMKAYAVIPMVCQWQWRALAVLVGGGVASIVLFWSLWSQYFTDYAGVQDWIVGATHGGASATSDSGLWAVGLGAVVVLAVFNKRDAGWVAVPMLWPAAQYFYATFIMPLRSPWLAAAVAASQAAVHLPIRLTMAQVLVIYTIARALGAALGWLRRRRWPDAAEVGLAGSTA